MLTPFHVISKPIGPFCNLDCKYCFYLEKGKLYPDTHGRQGWAMSDAVLESYVRQYIEAQSVPVVSFAWQGGEPTLLGVDFFRRVLKFQQQYAHGKRIENSLQTNGVLLDDQWGEFLSTNRFLVGISIDGPRGIHNRYRVDRAGAPSFDRVVRGIEVLKKHGVEFNTLTVVQRDNSRHPLEVYRFLKEVGSGFLQFIPIVERAAQTGAEDGLVLIAPDSEAPAKVSEWSVEPFQYGKFLCAVFDEWVRNDVGSVFVQLFDVTLQDWVGGPPSLCVFAPACGDAMVIEHNGDLYSCDHYVYSRYRLGNILEDSLAAMACSPQQRSFGEAKQTALPAYCRECEFLYACNGECPKHRFERTPDGEPGLNYLCPAYKRFFSHVEPYMTFMAGELANRRAPANVMQWARERDVQGPGKRQIGRNDPCPCGSGRKYKKCCGSAAAGRGRHPLTESRPAR
ncbi:MAG: anaerobic sulfatase-maturation protein [Bryobacterales bacterium]|nr:anaerobic sulfatase-maturation protein [Bryobacterales bacterium]